MSLFSLDSKVALVTGAANGNGKAIASGFKEAGASVISLDLENADVVCDVTDYDKMEVVLSSLDKVDILVNNAGVTYPAPFLSYPDDEWDRTYEVNLIAPFKLMQLVGEKMKTNKCGGSIINITSLNAELAFPDNPAYMAFKGALKQLTKSAAIDLGKYDIRVNNIGPGYFKTNMTRASWEDKEKYNARKKRTMLNRWGSPADLVGIAVFLASDASSYITSQDIYVDGGWSAKGL